MVSDDNFLLDIVLFEQHVTRPKHGDDFIDNITVYYMVKIAVVAATIRSDRVTVAYNVIDCDYCSRPYWLDRWRLRCIVNCSQYSFTHES